jgi:uncharacterized membrane protein
MEHLFEEIAGHAALVLEAAAVLIISIGALLALFQLSSFFTAGGPIGKRKQIWRNFGMWLLLGLEFELGADIIRTAIAPTWQDLGQLGAIAVIRTFLNYFLERDVEKYEQHVEAVSDRTGLDQDRAENTPTRRAVSAER